MEDKALAVEEAQRILQASGGAAAGAQKMALEEARAKGLFEKDIDELKDYTVRINDKDVTRKWTPLMYAAFKGITVEDVVLLKSAGADVMKQDQDGRSCLWVAAQNGHLDVVQFLEGKGGEKLLMLTTNYGLSCLLIAAQNGHLDVVRYLEGKGGEKLLMLTNKDGQSCLYIAAENGHLDVVRYLEGKGEEKLLMLTDENGDSCLLIAAENGHLDVVRYLEGKGGEKLLMLTNEYGKSCLHAAAEYGHLDVVKHLVAKGGMQLVSLSYNGMTAHDWAVEKGHTAVAAFLASA